MGMSQRKRNDSNGFLLILIFVFLVVSASSFFAKKKTSSVGLNKKEGSVYVMEGPVTDKAGLLDKKESDRISDFLFGLSEKSGVQIAVLIVDDTGGADIESFSMAHAEKWKIGDRQTDNGALLVISLEGHDIRIETGYGTEGVLTDAECARIIRHVIVPSFRNGMYAEGIEKAVMRMASLITGDEGLLSDDSKSYVDASREQSVQKGDGFAPFAIFIFLILFLSLASGRNFLWWPFFMMGFGGGHDRTFTKNHTRGDFHGGGGSFGGGGASGKW